MRILENITLTEKFLKELEDNFRSKIILPKTHLVYEEQIPISGFFLLNGNVDIYTNNKHIKFITAGTLFAVAECINKSPVSVTAEVSTESEIFLLDQSTINEILQTESSPCLKEIFNQIITSSRDQT